MKAYGQPGVPTFSYSSAKPWLSSLPLLFVCLFLLLYVKSTAMVMAGRSVHLTALFPGQAWTSSWPVFCAHTFACNWQQSFLNNSAEGRRMTIESMGPGRDRTRDPWICSQTGICCQTRYRLRYVAPLMLYIPLNNKTFSWVVQIEIVSCSRTQHCANGGIWICHLSSPVQLPSKWAIDVPLLFKILINLCNWSEQFDLHLT